MVFIKYYSNRGRLISNGFLLLYMIEYDHDQILCKGSKFILHHWDYNGQKAEQAIEYAMLRRFVPDIAIMKAALVTYEFNRRKIQ